MALTTYNITGNLEDAFGGTALLGEVTLTPYGTHDARVDGADAMLGSISYQLGKTEAEGGVPASLSLTAGAWIIVIRSKAGQGGGGQFKTITRTIDLQAATTWGAIVDGAISSPPMTPTLVERAEAAALAAETDATTASTSATNAAASEAAAEAAAATATAPTDDMVATLAADPASLTGAELRETFGRGVSVAAHGAVGDGVADDAPAFTAALAAASTFGADVWVPAGTYRFGSVVTALSNVTVRGDSGAVITATTAIAAAFGCGAGNSALANFAVENVEFRGGAVEEGVYPRRGRTTTPSFNSAIAFQGDRDPSGTYPDIRNVSVRNCRIVNTAGLPLFFQGVSGTVEVLDCTISNCMDSGFTYCESVTFARNHVSKGADNGVSASRECKMVVVADNTIEDCAYYGVWVSGYVGETVSTWGPDTFAVTGNIIRNCGHGGIALRDAPRFGSVAGNVVDGMVFGPTDEPSSSYGVAVSITGYPSTPLGPPTRYAEQIVVTGNLFRDCSRAGVGLRGARDVLVGHNLFIDVGEANDHAGTPIASTSTSANCGVYSSSGTTTDVNRIAVLDNVFTDTRTTAAMNYAVTTDVTGSADYYGKGNRAFRLRQPHTEDVQLANAAYLRGRDTAGTYRKLLGLTASDNVRTVLGKAAGQWEGYSADEAALLWRITSSGRADFSAGGMTTKYTSGAAAPGYTTNGQVQVWHDTGTGTSYLMVDVNGVIKKVALS